MPKLPPCSPLLVLTLVACNNYDFARVRRPDGSVDHARLIADLKASGRDSLRQGTWIPLIYMDIESFGPTDPGMPDGYRLARFTSHGPLFCVGEHDRRYLDQNGAWVEDDDRDWSLWGVLHRDHVTENETPRGIRRWSSGGWLVSNGEHTHYGLAKPSR